MSLELFFQTIFLFVFCLVLAALETQIEGEFGWAANLPTWKPSPSKFISRIYKKIMGDRELTLYHILVFTLILVFLHYPYFSGKNWNFSSELTTISLLFLIVVIWDFLWFVVNPKYDFGRFWGKHVLWHKKWFLHLPVDYWYAFIISLLLYTRLLSNWILLTEWLKIVGLFTIFTVVTIFFAIIAGIFKVKEEFKGNHEPKN